MDIRSPFAEMDLEGLILGLICFGPPVLGILWFLWFSIRESAIILAGRRRSGGRRKPHFSLSFLFVLTAAVAGSIVICRACGAEVGLPLLLYGLLSTVLLTAGCYFVYFLLEDFLIDAGWLTPRTSARRRLFGRRRIARDPFDRDNSTDEIEVRLPVADQESSSPDQKYPKKRRWWTRAMPNRTRTYGPGRDYEIPRDRDEYSG